MIKGTLTILFDTAEACTDTHEMDCVPADALRVAKAIVEKRKTVRAVILTEEETRACVRDGQMARFDRETR